MHYGPNWQQEKLTDDLRTEDNFTVLETINKFIIECV